MSKHIFRVPVDTENFQGTIVKGKTYEAIAAYLHSEDRASGKIDGLIAEAKDGKLRYWGSRPGANNLKTFEQLREGDEILFYRSGKYIAVATIAYKTVNRDIGLHSWKQPKSDNTWELVYFLRDVSLMAVDTAKINEAWGFKNGPVMGFSKLSDEKAQPFLAKYGSVAQFLTEQGILRPR